MTSGKDLSEDALVARSLRGDHDAFGMLVNRHAEQILNVAARMVGSRTEAEDLAQETFVRAFRGLGALRDESKLSTWLFQIAKNVARESLRERRRGGTRVEIDDEEVFFELHDQRPTPAGQLLDKELSGVIRKALMRLDEDKRLVFTLKVLQHRSYEEIAEITGFSVGKLKTDLHRARAEMRRRIGPYLGGEQ